jgi:hypothetical protein
MRVSPIVTFLSAAVGTTTASPAVRPRAVIDHDKVVGFPETVPDGNLGTAYLKFKPFLKVVNGCVPFPAVNAAGDTRYVHARDSPATSAE